MVKNCKIPSTIRHNGTEEIHPDLKVILGKALKKDLKERWKTIEELEMALRKFMVAHYPAFETSEFSRFVKTILASKFDEIQENVKETLNASGKDNPQMETGANGSILKHGKSLTTSLAKESSYLEINQNQLSAIEVKNGGKLLTNVPTHPSHLSTPGEGKSGGAKPQSRNSHGGSGVRIGKKAPRVSGFAYLARILLASAGIFALMVGYMNYMSAKTTTGKLSFNLTPERMLVSQGKTPLGGGDYMAGPSNLELPAGSYEYTFQREGFEGKRLLVKILPGSTKTVNVVLKKRSKSAPVVLTAEGNLPVTFTFPQNLASGVLQPGVKMQIQDLIENKPYTFTLTRKGENVSSTCTFIPISNNWTNPFLVTILQPSLKCRVEAPK
jgi:hypothetical protein